MRGTEIVGRHIRVAWNDNDYFTGAVSGYSRSRGHCITYDDGDVRWHLLAQEEWHFEEVASNKSEQSAPAAQQPAASAPAPAANTSSELSAQQPAASAPASVNTMAAPTLQSGMRVMLHSLKTVELNGRRGVFISWGESALLCDVRLDEGDSKTISVKLANIGLPEAQLASGTLVTLHSLNAAGMNGQQGTCLAWDGDRARWTVQLAERKVGVKTSNLLVSPAPASASSDSGTGTGTVTVAGACAGACTGAVAACPIEAGAGAGGATQTACAAKRAARKSTPKRGSGARSLKRGKRAEPGGRRQKRRRGGRGKKSETDDDDDDDDEEEEEEEEEEMEIESGGQGECFTRPHPKSHCSTHPT